MAFGLLLLLAALLPVRAEASRTSVWESTPPASFSVARTEATSAIAPLASAAAADIEAEEPPRFDLGDIVLVEREIEHEERFDLGPLELLGPTPLRGPPPSYPETRVGGFELLPPFRVGASPRLSLWPRQACGAFSCELVSDSPEDPWGLSRKTANGGTNYLGNLGDVVDVEGPVSEALSIGLDYVGNNVSDFLNLDYIVGQVMVAGDSTRSGGEQAAAAGKAVAVTALNAAGGEILGGGAKVLGKVPLVRKIAGSRLGQAIGRAFTKDLGTLFRKEATAGADAVAAEAAAVRVGEGQISWTAPNGRVFDSEDAYVAAMRHRRASMAAASKGRNAHRADEIRRAGFEPSDVRLSEGGRNFVPEAVEDLAGSPHYFELKTSGYYAASFQNNIYPSVISAGRRGLPFTVELRGTARMSRPLERVIRKVQERFGGSIIKGP